MDKKTLNKANNLQILLESIDRVSHILNENEGEFYLTDSKDRLLGLNLFRFCRVKTFKESFSKLLVSFKETIQKELNEL